MRLHSESEWVKPIVWYFKKYDSDGTLLAPRKSDKSEPGLDQYKGGR